jgi:hypothetical protein
MTGRDQLPRLQGTGVFQFADAVMLVAEVGPVVVDVLYA